MAINPMDSPPTDFGSDRYDYVEINGPVNPSGKWFEELLEVPCADCRANLFFKWRETDLDPSDREAWHITYAHDDGCPRLKKELEAE